MIDALPLYYSPWGVGKGVRELSWLSCPTSMADM